MSSAVAINTMSDQMPTTEENHLDDMLLRSIETLLDEPEQTMKPPPPPPMPQFHLTATVPMGTRGLDHLPQIPMTPNVQMDSSFNIGSETYRKWSNNESIEPAEKPVLRPTRLNFVKPKEPLKLFKKIRPSTPVSPNPMTPPMTPPPITPTGQQMANYQALVAEKANQILHQYMQLNYEFLSAQAAVLGIPLEQYIRNLMIATTNPPIVLPLQSGNVSPFAPSSPMPSMPNTPPTPRRPMNRMAFTKRNN